MPVCKCATCSINTALAYMNRLIKLGVEYPDAQWKTCQHLGVDHEKLQEAYDAQGK